MTVHSTKRPAAWLRTLGCLGAVGVMALAGCDKADEEKVLDIEAPGVDIEVNKSDDGASVEVEEQL